jgi:glyoxylase-like metal-dependent hydrolase (beta-lactamase superfamily II)
LCFYEERTKSLVTGDLVVSVGTVIIAPPDGDMRDYFASLERLLALPHGFMFPAHGPPIATTTAKLQEYLEHRRARERAILATLSEPRRPRDIVALVYADVPAEAHALALINVEAHLDKLVAEGRARRRGELVERGATA